MATVMIVDDEAIITKTLTMLMGIRTEHTVVAYNNPLEALAYIKENCGKIDVVISDFIMPDMNGIDFLLAIREYLPGMESILLTGYADKENAIKSINEVGVYYYLEKPWNNEELLKIVNNALEKKSLVDKLEEKVVELEKSSTEVNRLYELVKSDYNQEIEGSRSLMISMANVIEARDAYTDGHTRRVSAMAKAIGKRLNLEQVDLDTLEMVGIIHDIGKVSISDSILNKPGALTEEEFEVMKTHPVIGEKICRSLSMLETSLKPLLHHHEKLDGTGYPMGLKGDEIDTVTRIVAVADMFDAMYSDRPYRGKMPCAQVKEIFREEVAAGRIDGDITKILFELVESEEIA